ncbi:MAG: hypothetical protein M1813_000519 [Trichoglossum hirsutum]|nr:MAG: hypothetical protein M1813_000519 [Trichoglossum hirsutum]
MAWQTVWGKALLEEVEGVARATFENRADVMEHLQQLLLSAFPPEVCKMKLPSFCFRSIVVRHCLSPKMLSDLNMKHEVVCGCGGWIANSGDGSYRCCEHCRTSLIENPIISDPSRQAIMLTQKQLLSMSSEEDLAYVLALKRNVWDPNTGSDCALYHAAYWLSRCLKSHRDCYSLGSQSPVLPTRVIDVGSNDDSQTPFLHESQDGQRGTYCTLSYRWTKNATTTTKHTLPDFKRSIPVSRLSRTIQDAIIITRKLGVKYLWVDALCIIQDSRTDWLKESANMHAIYANSLLTIATIDSSDVLSGIFQPRRRNFLSSPRRRPTGMLDTRGWAMQEQLLSPRVLSYADGELFWTCSSSNCSESYPFGIDYTQDPDYRDANIQEVKRFLQHSGLDKERYYWLWRIAVTNYTMRDLSEERDRLAGISGVGTAFGLLLNDQLVAGVWRHQAAAHLAWWVRPTPKYNREPEPRLGPSHSRPTTFGAPTWSWLSVLGPVSYETISSYDFDHADDQRELGNFCVAVTVDRVDVNAAALGETISGSITLTGSLSKMFVRQGYPGFLFLSPGDERDANESSRGDPSGQLWPERYSPPPEDKGDIWEPWYPDVLPVSSTEIHCLYLGSGGPSRGVPFQYCICLVPTGRAGNEFERVGMCAWNPRHVDVEAGHEGEFRYGARSFATLQTVVIV